VLRCLRSFYLYKKREPIYRSVADLIVVNDGSIDVKEEIIKYIKLKEGEI
jgi:shikimate kinase